MSYLPKKNIGQRAEVTRFVYKSADTDEPLEESREYGVLRPRQMPDARVFIRRVGNAGKSQVVVKLGLELEESFEVFWKEREI